MKRDILELMLNLRVLKKALHTKLSKTGEREVGDHF